MLLGPQVGNQAVAVGLIQDLLESDRSLELDELHALARSAQDAQVNDAFMMCMEKIYLLETDTQRRIAALHALVAAVAPTADVKVDGTRVKDDAARIVKAGRLFFDLFVTKSLPVIAGEQLQYFMAIAWNLGLEAQRLGLNAQASLFFQKFVLLCGDDRALTEGILLLIY